MAKYALYLESGPRQRKTMVHVLDLLGCIAQGATTQAALESTPCVYLRYLVGKVDGLSDRTGVILCSRLPNRQHQPRKKVRRTCQVRRTHFVSSTISTSNATTGSLRPVLIETSVSSKR